MATAIIKFLLLFLAFYNPVLCNENYKKLYHFNSHIGTHLKLKAINIDGFYTDSLKKYWNTYKYKKISLRDIEDLSDKLGDLYLKNGYLKAKIYYRIIDHTVYLIFSRGKQFYLQLYSNDSVLNEKSGLKYTDFALDSLFNEYLKDKKDHGFPLARIDIDSVQKKDTIICFYLHVDKRESSKFSKTIIKPTKNKKYIADFFVGIKDIYDLNGVVLKLNQLPFFEISSPVFMKLNDSLVAIINTKNSKKDYMSGAIGGNNGKIFGNLKLNISNKFDYFNELVLNFNKINRETTDFNVFYLWLPFKKHFITSSVNFSLYGYDSLNSRINSSILFKKYFNNLVIGLGSHYERRIIENALSNYYGVELLLTSKENVDFNLDVKNYYYKFKWVNYYKKRSFQRDFFLELIYKYPIWNKSYMGNILFSSYSENNISPNIIDVNYVRGIIPFVYAGDCFSLKNSFIINKSAIKFYLFFDYMRLISVNSNNFTFGTGAKFFKKNGVSMDFNIGKSVGYINNTGVLNIEISYDL